MLSRALYLVCPMALGVLSCQRSERVEFSEPRRFHVPDTSPERLLLKRGPPVWPAKPLLDEGWLGREKVRYFAYDLNEDGEDEYFIVDNTGANKAVFVLLDQRGRSLLLPVREEREYRKVAQGDGAICCDLIFILPSKHAGYFDFFSAAKFGGWPVQEWTFWRFRRGRYVRRRVEHETFIPCLDGLPNVRAFWDLTQGYEEHEKDSHDLPTAR